MRFFRNFPVTDFDVYGDGSTRKVVDIFRFVKPIENFIDDLSLYAFYQVEDGDRPDIVSQKLYGTPEYHWTFFIINEHLRGGPQRWPLSNDEFERYLISEYNGTVVNCIPDYRYDSDGLLIGIENSVANRFEVGEPVVGFVSGATGTLYSKDPNLQQLVITDVSGNFLENELIRGQYTEDFVTSYQVFDWALAPHHYEDMSGREVDNGLFVEGGYSHVTSVTITNREYENALNDSFSKIRVIKPKHIFEFVDKYNSIISQ